MRLRRAAIVCQQTKPWFNRHRGGAYLISTAAVHDVAAQAGIDADQVIRTPRIDKAAERHVHKEVVGSARHALEVSRHDGVVNRQVAAAYLGYSAALARPITIRIATIICDGDEGFLQFVGDWRGKRILCGS